MNDKIFNVLSYDQCFSDFVKINTDISPKFCKFLIDTQADISLIKESSVYKDLVINTYDKIVIRGIAEDTIETIGSAYSYIYVNDSYLEHKIYIVPDSFNIPSDGILGKDFLKEYNGNIDYKNMLVTIEVCGKVINLELYDGPECDTIVIPPRCEIIRKVSFRKHGRSKLLLVPNQEVGDGVFTANAIVNSDYAYIRFVNVSLDSRSIKINSLKNYDLNEFNVYNINKVDGDRTEKLLNILMEDVPDYVQKDFSQLCAQYSDIFALPTDKMTTNNFYTQKIRLIDEDPVYVKNYRQAQVHKDEINKQTDSYLKSGLIEPSISAYNSPVIVVPKKGDSKWRMCIDYRILNKKIKPDKFPLPRIDEILDGLGRAKYFSILDLFQGFHQIPLDDESRDMTSFSTDKGSFRWKVVPFGLNIAPNSFSRMMSIAFSGLTPDKCFLYMDDLIVIGNSEKHHLRNLKLVFDACKKFNLKLNPSKCKFFRSEVTYLGHKCTRDGVLPDDSKISSVMNYPTPTDKDSVRRFVAFCNYYRKFIHNFASIAFPLNKLTRKKSKFIWTDDCNVAFHKLKNSLISPRILKYPDFSKPFIITVDASQNGTGAILSQIHDNCDLPVAYASKQFTKGESHKSTIEQELIAIHFAITYFRPYIYGTEFLVKSDHRPLIYLYGLKDPSSKLTRIRLELEEFNFKVEHIKGKDNVGADALSRLSISDFKSVKSDVQVLALTRSMTKSIERRNIKLNLSDHNKKGDETDETEIQVYNQLGFFSFNSTPRLTTSTLTDTQGARVFNLSVIKKHKRLFLLRLTESSLFDTSCIEQMFSLLEETASRHNVSRVHIQANDSLFAYLPVEKFKIIGNSILSKLSIIISNPTEIINNDDEKIRIIKQMHDDPIDGGHCGQRRLYNKIRTRYFWKYMLRDIQNYVRKCHNCQINKSYTKTKESLALTATPCNPFDIVTIDTIGPLPKTDNGNVYAVTLICNLTKYLVSVSVPNKESRTVAKAIFDDFISIYGPMKKLLSDRGTEYKNQTVHELCEMLNITITHSTAHHHETVGTIERNHRTLNEYLRSYLNNQHSNWDDYLKKFTYCYNSTPHSSLNFKYTPYELIFGKKPHSLDIFNNNAIEPLYNIDNYAKELKFKLQVAHAMAKRLVELSKIEHKHHYDKYLNEIDLKIGDKILVKNNDGHKLDQQYLGPFIISKIDDKNVSVTDNGTEHVIHKNRIKKYTQ